MKTPIDLSKDLKVKNISYTQSFNGNNLRKKWIKAFANNIDTTVIHIEQYLWHIFSYERLSYLDGNKADEKMLYLKKKFVYIFFNEGDICYHLNNANEFTPNDIKHYQDIYVVDENFSWTYVVTHEKFCGPYFYSKEMK